AKGEKDAAPANGFGCYRAADYDELIDHPFELGTFTLAGFSACGVPHQVAISGRHDGDLKRLTADLRRICEWQIRFFGEPAPMSHYLFLINVVSEGYGGLEHRCSTALICSRDDLPYPGMKSVSERYRGFLGLCSHEYFHAWNVKRIKPAAFARYDLDVENYTTLLWAFEGFTSYYDDLALLRSGLIKPGEWLALLGKMMDKVRNLPGRHRQSLAESSFDAWIKFYRPDENTPNAVVSYYSKGALVALALDLTLRAGTDGKVSLDDLMRLLWQRHGLSGHPVGDDDLRLLAEELSGIDLREFFATAIDGTADLPWRRLLKRFALRLRRITSESAPSLGGRLVDDGRELRVAAVYENGALQRSGVSAGDVLLAIDGLRVTPSSIKRLLVRRRAGERVVMHVFRDDELRQFTVRLAPPARDTHQLRLKNRANAWRRAWLGK
ncbi:MAG TPA: PDZ domain-containing protein, partial [Accumulibacter sp.]|nr:PDZ domain-containing protein [Accumulibacter sp.]